jgi:putative DNA primase/helicase
MMNEFGVPNVSVDVVLKWIAEHIGAYSEGGSDREAEDITVALKRGLDVEAIKARWAEAKAALFICPPTQLNIVHGSNVQPKEVEGAPGRVALSPSVDLRAPYEVAKRFLRDRYSVGGVLTLRWWNGEWRSWNGTHYAEIEEDALRAKLYQFLAKANHGKFDPAQKHVNAVIDAVKAWSLLPGDVEVGTWLGEGAPPWGCGAIICCKNGVVRLNDGRSWPHDPRLFVLNVIETEYRPDAVAPRWEQFLRELWKRDEASRNTLQEFFGLVLTDETRFQKGFILVGPARSGKGTIARVLMHLIGRTNFCGPNLGQFSHQFGMQGLIGKKLAVVPDARLDGRANRSVITEKLLSIIGEDVQDINRKNKAYWSGILRLRVMILSNELPDFKDDTGVIAMRFVILQTSVSFLGREDLGLEEKLCEELSGILNWALAGWQRLVERGKFGPGRTELNEELASNASAVKAFVADRCQLGKDYMETIDAVYNAYRAWCEDSDCIGWADRVPINQFSGKLRSAFHGQIDVFRPRTGNSERKRMFVGIRLRTDWSA